MRHCRYLILLTFIAGLVAQSRPYTLNVERRGNLLNVIAPYFHFLEGKPLERLQNGASVTYVFELTLTADPAESAVTRLRRRFIISFDLWEERFAVVQPDPPGQTGSHMTAAMAEAWCLERMPLPLPALTRDKSFVIKLDCWAEPDRSDGSEGGLTLAGLIDAFSRKGRDAVPRWQATTGSLRLADLKDSKREQK